jgi:hypothetical protein
MEISKFYGPKPSYRIMKTLMKEDDSTSFYQHGMNLVYYCIKHNFTEEQVIEYLDKMCDKCDKYINNHDPNIYERIPYHLMKDIFNTSKDDFILNHYLSYKYDWKTHTYTKETEEYFNYEWINNSISFNSKENRYNNLFRQYSYHSVWITNNMKNHNHYIFLRKVYDKDSDIDMVYVYFDKHTFAKHPDVFKHICLFFWHFMKLFDEIEEKDKNDISISELYKRKEKPDKVYDRRK